MFAGMAQAYTMTHMRGDGKTGTVLVQGMENYDAALATWTNGQCPDDNSWSEILDCGSFAALYNQNWIMLDYEIKSDGSGYRMYENSTGIALRKTIWGFLGKDNFAVKTKNSFRLTMNDMIEKMVQPGLLQEIMEDFEGDGEWFNGTDYITAVDGFQIEIEGYTWEYVSGLKGWMIVN